MGCVWCVVTDQVDSGYMRFSRRWLGRLFCWKYSGGFDTGVTPTKRWWTRLCFVHARCNLNTTTAASSVIGQVLLFVSHTSENSIPLLPCSWQPVFLPSWPHRSPCSAQVFIHQLLYIAPEVSSTRAWLQANVIASRDHLQRPVAEESHRDRRRVTTTQFSRTSNPSAELSYCFELGLHGTELCITPGNTQAGTCLSETPLSKPRGGTCNENGGLEISR